MRFTLWIVVALLSALLEGCSALRLTYPQADVFLSWRARTYFDLDRDQRQDFGTRLERLLAWHRYEQLPDYAAFLTTAIAKAEPGLKREDILWFVDGISTRYRVIVNRASPDAAEVLATITPDQIGALQKQLDKDNRKYVSENELNEKPDRRKHARLKKTESQIEDWTGSLTHEQERKVATLLEPIPLIEHLRYQDRLRRQHEFVELLKQRQSKDFEPRLRQWLIEWDHGRTPEYSQLAKQVFDQRVGFYIAVEKILTPDQRQTFISRMQKFADDCKSLSARPGSSAALPLDTAIALLE